MKNSSTFLGTVTLIFLFCLFAQQLRGQCIPNRPVVYNIELSGSTSNGWPFTRNGQLLVTPRITAAGSVNLNNGPNDREIGIVSGQPFNFPEAGAIHFMSNTALCAPLGLRCNSTPVDAALDLVYTQINSNTLYTRLDGSVIGNVNVGSILKANFLNIFSTTSRVDASLYEIATGTIDLSFANNGQSVTGFINIAGSSRLGPSTYTASISGSCASTAGCSCNAVPNTLSVSPTSLSFSSGAENKTFSVSSNTSWTVAESLSWLSVSPASGSNNGTATVSCQANTSTSSRTGTISVSANGVTTQNITITQAGITPSLSVSSTSLSFSAGAENKTFSISSNTSWTVSESLSWLSTSPASGTSNGTVTVSCEANSATAARTGVVTVSSTTGSVSQTISITQAGAPPTLSVTPTSLSFSPGNENKEIFVTSNTNWTVTESLSWLSMSSTAGSSNGTLTVSCQENNSTTSRTGTITLSASGTASRTIAVTQAGVAANCGIPANLRVSGKGYSWMRIEWDSVPGVKTYSYRRKRPENTNWISTSDSFNFRSLTIVGASPCTDYIFQVRSVCGGAFGPWSPEIRFSLEGCNDPYCYSYGVAIRDWLAGIDFASISNRTERQNGYANYTNLHGRIAPGKSYPITLFSKNTSLSQNETYHWNVWIDLNQDNDFNDDTELVFSQTASRAASVEGFSGSISVPPSAKIGMTRMRVSLSMAAVTDPCTRGSLQDVQDYGIELSQEANSLSVSPNLLNFAAGGGSKSFSINSNTSWTLSSSQSWLTPSPLSGNNNGNVSVVAQPNTSTNSRSATVTVAGGGVSSQTISVTQAGIPVSILPASWMVKTTENSHTIILPKGLISDIEGQPLAPGDYIGIFFQHQGREICAGNGVWTGVNTSFPVFGDDASTQEKDGMGPGERFIVKIWQTSTKEELKASAAYGPIDTLGLINAKDQYLSDAFSMITRVSASKAETLSIPLKKGWNMISSYIIPKQLLLDSIVSQLQGVVQVVKDGAGKTFIADPLINGIGSWKITEGYRVRSASDAALQLTGKAVNPQLNPIPIRVGWQIIPVFSRVQQPLTAALSSISGLIEVVKDNKGQVYLPELDINSIGMLLPTQGYRLRAKAAGELSFSQEGMFSSQSGIWSNVFEKLATDSMLYFRLPAEYNTDANATLVFLAAGLGNVLQPGDELGIFAADTLLCGAGKYTGTNLAITVWGDDTARPGRQGMLPGERYKISVWKRSENKTHQLIPVFAQGKEQYQEDDVAIINSATLLTTSVRERIQDQAIAIFPNPSNGNLTLIPKIAIMGMTQVRIINAAGQVVWERRHSDGLLLGVPQQMNLPMLPNGMYAVRIQSMDGVWINKVQIVR